MRIEKIKRYQPQLVFMDVDLGDGTSFDILSSLEEVNFKVIFVIKINWQPTIDFHGYSSNGVWD